MNERIRRVNVWDEQMQFVNRLRMGLPSERTANRAETAQYYLRLRGRGIMTKPAKSKTKLVVHP